MTTLTAQLLYTVITLDAPANCTTTFCGPDVEVTRANFALLRLLALLGQRAGVGVPSPAHRSVSSCWGLRQISTSNVHVGEAQYICVAETVDLVKAEGVMDVTNWWTRRPLHWSVARARISW